MGWAAGEMAAAWRPTGLVPRLSHTIWDGAHKERERHGGSDVGKRQLREERALEPGERGGAAGALGRAGRT